MEVTTGRRWLVCGAALAVCTPCEAFAYQSDGPAQAAGGTAPAEAKTQPDVSLGGAPAVAQSGVPSNADIIVTATRRREDIQKVSASVTALDTAALTTRGITQTSDLQTQVPGIFVGSSAGATILAVRGISSDSTSGSAEPSVAVLINGVYIARPFALNVALSDLASVEALKGPQGTLYGRNATGGALLYELAAPTDTLHGGVSGLIANYRRYRARGFLSGPLTDTLSFRVSGIFERQEHGFIENLLMMGRKYDRPRTNGGRAALNWKPTSDLTISLDTLIVHGDASDPMQSVRDIPTVGGAPAGPYTIEPHKVYSNADQVQPFSQWITSAKVEWKAADWLTLQNIASFVRFRSHPITDTEETGSTLGGLDRGDKKFEYV